MGWVEENQKKASLHSSREATAAGHIFTFCQSSVITKRKKGTWWKGKGKSEEHTRMGGCAETSTRRSVDGGA
jgi:hypothetical protein